MLWILLVFVLYAAMTIVGNDYIAILANAGW